MSLMGRYTTYAGGFASDSHKLLSRLFPASADYPTAKALQEAAASGDEVAAQVVIQANATANVDPATGIGGIQPANGFQKGDMGMFPTGVQRGYGDSPDVTTVKWNVAGDPANPYAPDITSPGPGKTDGKDKDVDPGISIADIQEFSTTQDPAGENLRNPTIDAAAIYGNNFIGQPQIPGDSGANV